MRLPIVAVSLLGSNAVLAIPATATYFYVEESGAKSVPGLSDFDSYSQAGVNSDGSETTYVEEIHRSQIVSVAPTELQAAPLNSTLTLYATRVQSSGGYWISLDVTVTPSVGETGTSQVAPVTPYQYQSCTLDVDEEGSGSCVYWDVAGGTTKIRDSWSGTVENVVRTDVGEPSGAENSAEMLMSVMTRLGVVTAAMALGVVLVL